ncbi:retinol dehydrogenase 12 [Durotheca rogersii]|uniref:retinol dehydrogenase 12 n=1 Tax=Durotheca rogersii TaxID=419775 RepID=UPI002220BB7F|nr:retinol dehydrogenase 12 [Durotheca rogersii]KAI5867517.1 retinol dehydrogenase 12 [Durotheca rogersii]
MAEFNVTPEQRASQGAFFRRQLFSKPPHTSRREVDLAGKTAIVTGSNTGIGLECSRQLLGLGVSKLILAVRSEAKGEAAKKVLVGKKAGTTQTVEVWKLDLSSYKSVSDFVVKTQTLDRLDIVVHNAGVVKVEQEINRSTGHDEVIQVNYLSTALLTILLLPVLKEKNSRQKPGRLVIVSSDVASWAQFKEKTSNPLLPAFDTNQFFDGQDRYYTSKLLGQIFLSELERHVPSSGGVVVNCANPGLCYGSGLNRDSNGTGAGLIFGAFKRVVGRSCAAGAWSLTNAAVKHGEESHCKYIEEGKLQPMSPLVYTDEGKQIAKLLWKETMDELAFAKVDDIIEGLSK